MPDSPLAASPYEVLGVPATATDDELRRAYRRRARETHPDTGGAAREFDAVQRAWELIGTTEGRAAYDRGVRPSADEERSWAPTTRPARGEGTRPAARSHGHPGGWYREEFLALLQEWAGRGVDLPDPYDPQLLARAPRELRRLLAEAVAEEDTARALASLGIGFTVWHDLRTDPDASTGLAASPQGAGGKLDHVVLGPTGLWAMLSEDWGDEVSVRRGEVVGRALAPGERPVHELSVRARRFARGARVRFSALVVVVSDGRSPEGVIDLGPLRGSRVLLVQRPRLVDLVRRGIPGVGTGGTDLFEVRTRVQASARFV